MSDHLAAAKWRLSSAFDQRGETLVAPLRVDQWTANSLLQKAIRRGQTEVARRAALTFLAQRGTAIWRRFMVIAVEDVGAASVDVVATTVAASADSKWRKQNGGDTEIALQLTELLATVPKSRSAEHLVTIAKHHPDFEAVRLQVAGSSINDSLSMLRDGFRPIEHRAIAACRLSAIKPAGGASAGEGFGALLEAYRHLGVPEELVVATELAAARVRDAITSIVPLVWLAAKDAGEPTAMNAAVPRTVCLDEVPMYALDKHTRVGREAIRVFVKYNSEIRDCLQRYVAPNQWNDAAYMAAFYADAAPLAKKLVWQRADELEALGTEADLLRAGVAPEGIVPLLEVFRANLGHLNKLRAHTFGKKLGFVDVAQALLFDEEGSK